MFLGDHTANAQKAFLEEFNGPDLDPSWLIFDNEGGTHVGFTDEGEYEVVDSQSKSDAGLGLKLSGSGDFTVDATIRLENIFDGRFDFKFRFLAPKFMELVFNQNDFMRVFSGERGSNTVQIPSFGYEEGSSMHIRFAWTESTGTMRIGVAKGEETMQLINTISGLQKFQPTRLDLILFRIGAGEHTPRLFYDRIQIQDKALPIGVSSFVDDFSGPKLDERWVPLGKSENSQVGFSDGIYEIKGQQGSDAGLRHKIEGTGSFTANARIKLKDFSKSASDFKFRFLVGGLIEIVYNSFDDIRVYSGELGENIARFNKIGFKDGDVIDLKLAYDDLAKTVQVGVAQNDGPMILLAQESGLFEFEPENLDLVLFKFGEGNGNEPRLQLDHFDISDGYVPVEVQTIIDDFDGPELISPWIVLGEESEHIGFDDKGRYQFKSALSPNNKAGLGLRLPSPGSTTVDLNLSLSEFVDSNSALIMRFPGSDALEILVGGDKTFEVIFSGDSLLKLDDFNLGDEETLNLRFGWDSTLELFEVGAGINGQGLELMLEEFGEGWQPRMLEILLSSSGEKDPSTAVYLDSFSARSGFSQIPTERLEPFIDEFEDPLLSDTWITIDEDAQLGISNGTYRFKDPSRSSNAAGIKHIFTGQGSFTVDAHVIFEQFNETGSDFKLRFFGGKFIELVYNSFDDIRMHSGEKGGINRIEDIGILEKETVQFRFVWNEPAGQAQYGVFTGDKWTLVGSVSGLTEFTPNSLDMILFKFGDGPEPIVSIDRFEIRSGIDEIPMDPPIQPYRDDFDGPKLAESWILRDESPEAQRGFENGFYELRDPSTSASDVGLRHAIEGKGGSFTSDFGFTFDGFSGSATDFKFRFFGGKFIEFVYNSFDDLRVYSQERGENVSKIQKVGINDGDAVKIRFIWNEISSEVIIGLSIRDEPMKEIAKISGLKEFTPEIVDFIMFKFGEGNGNTPGLLVDYFEIVPGVSPIPEVQPPVEGIVETFDGPELGEDWSVRDDSADAQIGFTEDGRYQVNEPSTSAGGDAGIRRSFTSGGSFTADLNMHFEDFIGSHTDFKFRFFGGKFLELVFNSFDDVRVFSAEKGGNVNRLDDIGVTDGAPLHFRFIWDAETGNATYGVSIDGGAMVEIATAEGLKAFEPNIVDFVMFKFGEGNGNTPKMLIDHFEIRDGVFPLSEVQPPVEGIVETFDGPELGEDWSVRDDSADAQIGFTEDGRYQVNEPSTSAGGDAGIRRSFTSGGSFTADLNMHFEDFIGSHTDFKFRFFGGKFLELVFNSFDDVRVFSAEKGGNVNRLDDIGVTDGAPLHFRFIWDAETGNATYGVSIDGGAMVEIATAEGLKAFEPNIVDFVMFKFGEGNGNTPKMLIDHFEIRDGVFPLSESGNESVIEITSIDVTNTAPQTVTITWSSTPGATYNVEWSNDLLEWNNLIDDIPSDGDDTTVKNENIPADDDRRFYRVKQSSD